MNKKSAVGCLGLCMLAAVPAVGWAYVMGHHGGLIINCTAPTIFDESPGKDAKVALIEKFSFTASDNTEADTVQAWANNEPVAVTITRQRSGNLLVEGKLAQPVPKGRVWFRVTAVSDDGCDQLHTWNVYAGQ